MAEGSLSHLSNHSIIQIPFLEKGTQTTGFCPAVGQNIIESTLFPLELMAKLSLTSLGEEFFPVPTDSTNPVHYLSPLWAEVGVYTA